MRVNSHDLSRENARTPGFQVPADTSFCPFTQHVHAHAHVCTNTHTYSRACQVAWTHKYWSCAFPKALLLAVKGSLINKISPGCPYGLDWGVSRGNSHGTSSSMGSPRGDPSGSPWCTLHHVAKSRKQRVCLTGPSLPPSSSLQEPPVSSHWLSAAVPQTTEKSVNIKQLPPTGEPCFSNLIRPTNLPKIIFSH